MYSHTYQYLGMPSVQSSTPKFWMIWTPNGNNPVIRHPDRDSAVKECARLAVENPGREFYVIAATAFVVWNPPKPVPEAGLTYNWMTKLGGITWLG